MWLRELVIYTYVDNSIIILATYMTLLYYNITIINVIMIYDVRLILLQWVIIPIYKLLSP